MVGLGSDVLLGTVVKVAGMPESPVDREGTVPAQTGGAVIARGKAGDSVSLTTLLSVCPPKLRLVIRYYGSASVSSVLPSGKTLTLSLK